MMFSTLLNLLVLSNGALARRRHHERSSSSSWSDSDSCERRGRYERRLECNEIRECEAINRIFCKDVSLEKPCKPCETPCYDYCEIPYNCFSTTCSYKFTEMTYNAIKELVLPSFDFCRPLHCGLKYYKRKECNVECEIYKLLLHAINTVSPCVFDAYYDAFYSGNFYECFLILQRLYSCDAEIERIIIESIVRKNKECRRKTITSICFVDPCTRECSVIDLPCCGCEKRVCLYLPRHCLKFEEFICLSFCVDDAIICEIDHFVPCGFKNFYYEIVKKFFKYFKHLSVEKRVLWWLRIKFFVFNCIGYSISYLNSGTKNQVLDLLIKTATSENDAFYLAYARSLGLINK